MKDDLNREADGSGLDLHQFLTFRLARVQAKLNAQATRILREVAGLSLTQWRIIALIGNASGDGPTRSADLTRAAEFDKGQFSRKLKTLVETGLVVAQVDERDNRVQLLSLSDAGQALFDRTWPTMQARQAALRATITAEERDALISALDKLEAASERTEFAP